MKEVRVFVLELVDSNHTHHKIKGEPIWKL